MKTKKITKNLPISVYLFAFAIIAVFGFSLFTYNQIDSNVKQSSASAAVPADINNDNKVDIFDLSMLLSNWNKTGVNTSDLNTDSVVNVFDLSILLSKWGVVANLTPTPTPVGTCVGNIHSPGGPDGMGGCWPGPQNTGYPHGLAGDIRTPVTLTNYTGPLTIQSCGVVIDSKTVNGDLLITAGNGTHSASTPCVTIKNSLVKGTIHTDNDNQGPVVIMDTEIAVPGGAWWASTGFYNTFDWRVNSHGGQGTIKCQAYCESYDSWVHGMYLEKSYHYNSWGGNGIEAVDGFFKIEHGYADCGGFEGKSPDATSDAGCSADIGFYGDFAPVRNIIINKTFFAAAKPNTTYDSGTQPGYCYNPGYYPGKPYPNPSNITFTNNIFERGPTGKCGTYGASNTWLSGNGNTWSGNKWDDGTVLNP